MIFKIYFLVRKIGFGLPPAWFSVLSLKNCAFLLRTCFFAIVEAKRGVAALQLGRM
jgi:hypothetical protein